jgi:tetratricopeptide (TPR) repeat protein
MSSSTNHFGSRTFTALGVDCRRLLAGNFERFQAKWGPGHAAGYRLPAPAGDPAPPAPVPTAVVSARPPGARVRVSLCLIVRDEEHNLPPCLGSVRDLVDEVVVVDTGSADRTREVAARLGAKVFDFPWCDSFAAARNASLRHATGDWVFWLDADDRLDDDNRGKLGALLAGLGEENAAYVLKCLCLPDAQARGGILVDHVRLFRNRPDMRWEYRVHEQILPAVRRSGAEVRWSDVVIHHTGYQDPALRRRKLQRDLRLLRLEEAENPDEPFVLFNLGSILQELGQAAEALPLFRRSLARSHPSDSIVRKLYALIGQCHRQLGQGPAALAACREGRAHYPDDAELLFLESLVRQEAGDRSGAIAGLVRLLEGREAEHFGSVATGLRGYKARHQLAVLYRELGQPRAAEDQWRQAVAEQPDFLPGWVGLGELAVAAGRWADLGEAVGRLEADLGGGVEAAVLRARGHLARHQFDAARSAQAGAIAGSPGAVWPRVILTHVLLQEGRDWAGAERALRDVLALDPGHAEARQNLDLLVRQQGRAAG